MTHTKFLFLLACAISIPVPAQTWEPVETAENGKDPTAFLDKSRIFHIDDTLSVFVREDIPNADPAKKFGATYRVRAIQLSCNSAVVSQIYVDLNSDKGLIARAYGKTGFNHYAEPHTLALEPNSVLDTLRTKECKNVPERLANIAIGNDDVWSQIDANSIRRDGDRVSVTARFDYPLETHDSPYQNPYDAKRERLVFACKEKRYTILWGCDFDAQEHANDCSLFDGELHDYVGDSDLDYQKIGNYVCAENNPQRTVGIGGAVKRTKSAPAPINHVTTMEALSPSVQQAVGNALGNWSPHLQLKHVVTETKSTYEQKTETTRTTLTLHSVSGGLWLISARGEGYSSEDLSLLGLVELSRATDYSSIGMHGISVLDELEMPLLASVLRVGKSFSIRTRHNDTETGPPPVKRDNQCRVTGKISAKTLHPNLVGSAYRIECETRIAGKHANWYSGYMLPDEGWFFSDYSETSNYRGDVKIIDVTK